VKEIRAHLDL
jgi:hypothetical protein